MPDNNNLLLLRLNGLIDELHGAINTTADVGIRDWLEYVHGRLKTIVEADAERTKDA